MAEDPDLDSIGSRARLHRSNAFAFVAALAMRRTIVAIQAATLVVALLALTIAETPGASMRIFWRYAVLSFDNPATQVFDEVASTSLGLTEPDAGAHTFGRLPLLSRFGAIPAPLALRSPALSSCLTRSPPAA